MEQFASVRAGLQEAGIPLDADISGLELIPVSEIEVSHSPQLMKFPIYGTCFLRWGGPLSNMNLLALPYPDDYCA